MQRAYFPSLAPHTSLYVPVSFSSRGVCMINDASVMRCFLLSFYLIDQNTWKRDKHKTKRGSGNKLVLKKNLPLSLSLSLSLYIPSEHVCELSKAGSQAGSFIRPSVYSGLSSFSAPFIQLSWLIDSGIYTRAKKKWTQINISLIPLHPPPADFFSAGPPWRQ